MLPKLNWCGGKPEFCKQLLLCWKHHAMPSDEMRKEIGFQILDVEMVTIVVRRGPPGGVFGAGRQIMRERWLSVNTPGYRWVYVPCVAKRRRSTSSGQPPTHHIVIGRLPHVMPNCAWDMFESSGVRHADRGMSMKMVIAPARNRTIDAVHTVTPSRPHPPRTMENDPSSLSIPYPAGVNVESSPRTP